MKNNAKRILSLALCALMLISALAATACGGSDPVQSTDTTASPSAGETTAPVPETTESPYDENGYLKDDLPKDLNFKGETFHILGWKHGNPEFDTESLTGDVINDSIYNRNQKIEDRLGVDLEFTIIDGNNAAVASFCNTVTNNVQANAQAYDAIACYPRSAASLAVNHMLLDLQEVEYLNFDQPWWPKSLLELYTLYDNLYFMTGDIASTVLFQMMFMVYNNDLGKDFGLENPQQLAADGKWTMEKMLSLTTGVYADLDGDQKKSEDDRYGLFSITHPNLDIFYIGADMHLVETDKEGNIIVSEDFFSERHYSLNDMLRNIYHVSNDGYFSKSLTNSGIWANGNSLLYNVTGQILYKNIRQSEMNYSILPAPKFDEKQENYATAIAFTHTSYCLAIDTRDTEMSGAVLEAMASEGYRTVTPAIFETAFKYQYSNSQLDADLFDVIRSSVSFDLGRPFHDELGGDSSAPTILWRNQVINNVNQLSALEATFSKMWAKTLEKINAKLMEE